MQQKKQSLTYIISASSVGTLIEWYDFYIFGSLATVLSTKFFPASDGTAAFLNTLATFAAGFVVRPFGALVFGRLGDLIGRKYTFLLTLLLMGGATFAIGLVPSYASIGALAPALVLVLRLLQGLALGGEYGGAATYVAEHSSDQRRGFFTSWIQTTATLGLVISLSVIMLTKWSMSTEDFQDYGWRIPFLLSAFMVLLSFLIRRNMAESPLFEAAKSQGKIAQNPLKESFGNAYNLKFVLLALFGATMGQGLVWYTGQFYAQTFLIKICHLEDGQANTLMVIGLLLGTPLFILFGALSDRWGRKPIMLSGMALGLLCYRPIFERMYQITQAKAQVLVDAAGQSQVQILLDRQDQISLIALIFCLISFVTMAYGPIAAFLVELFPTRIRYTSMSLPYHIGNGVFGGLMPAIATFLVSNAQKANEAAAAQGLGPVYEKAYLEGLNYPMALILVCLVIGLIYMKDTKHHLAP